MFWSLGFVYDLDIVICVFNHLNRIIMKKNLDQKGALLIEILLAILIASVVIGVVAGLVLVSSKSGQNSSARNKAISLAQEGMEAMQSIADADWHKIYSPPTPGTKGDAAEYYVYNDGSSWVLTGTDISKREIALDGLDGIVYSRKVYIYNVNRSINNTLNRGDEYGDIVSSGGTEDPSSQRIKVVVSSSGSQDVTAEEYLTRWKNNILSQSDWSGGAGQPGPTPDPGNKFDSNPDGNIEINNPAGSIKLKAQ